MIEVKKIVDEANANMQKAISHLEAELAKIRAGRANPSMLEGIHVDYYGTKTPLNQVANVTTPDPKTIVIQAWDKGTLPLIEKAIMAANLGFTPVNDGNVVRINMPTLPEEKRKELGKRRTTEGEKAKISVLNSSREATRKQTKE